MIRHFPGHQAWTTADFSPDGKRVALAGYHPGKVPVWDVDSGEQVCVIEQGAKATRFSSDGKILFTGTNHTLTGYNVATCERLPRFAKRGTGYWMIATAPAGTLVAGNSPQGELWVWDWETRRLVVQAAGVGTGIHNCKDLEFTPDGKSLLVMAKVNGVELRDAETLAITRQFSTGRVRVKSIGVSGDGKRLAIGGFAGRVHVFDLNTGKEVNAWRAHTDHVSAVALSPDGERLACGVDGGGDVRIWDVATMTELFPTTGHSATVGEIAVRKDGTVISQDHGWHLGQWNPATGESIKFWKWPWPQGMSIEWAYSSQADRTLIGNDSLYLGADPSDPKNTYIDVFAKADPPDRKGRIEVVAISADGHYGAAATQDDHITVCDLNKLTHVRTFTLPKVQHLAWTREYSLALSPDGGVLAGASQDKVQLWELETGKELPSPKPGFRVYDLAFTPDGKTLALNGGRQVTLWDVKKGQLRTVIQVEDSGVQSMAFSPDGAIMATGSFDTKDIVRVWELATGKEIRNLRGARGGVASLAFSLDGRTLICGHGQFSDPRLAPGSGIVVSVDPQFRETGVHAHLPYLNASLSNPRSSRPSWGHRMATKMKWHLQHKLPWRTDSKADWTAMAS